jgi:hypothetical protein
VGRHYRGFRHIEAGIAGREDLVGRKERESEMEMVRSLVEGGIGVGEEHRSLAGVEEGLHSLDDVEEGLHSLDVVEEVYLHNWELVGKVSEMARERSLVAVGREIGFEEDIEVVRRSLVGEEDNHLAGVGYLRCSNRCLTF